MKHSKLWAAANQKLATHTANKTRIQNTSAVIVSDIQGSSVFILLSWQHSSHHVRLRQTKKRKRLSKSDKPDPATPTVAAPAPMNLAAESISLDTGDVWKLRMAGRRAGCFCCCCTVCTSDWLWATALLSGLKYCLEFAMSCSKNQIK